MIDTGRAHTAPAWRVPLTAHRPATPTLLAIPAALALALVVAAVRSHALAAPLWMDEGISVGIASHPLHDIPGLLRQDGSPPLYYVVLHVWMALFGSTPTATHVLSLAFFSLSVPAAVWAAWSPFGAVAGVLAGALVALDPFTVYYANDTRMYTLVLLLAILATGAFVRAFALRRRAHVPAFAVLLAALLYTHTWALFFAAGAAGALAVLTALSADRRGLVRDGVLAFGGAALLFAPWLPTLAFQAAHTGAPWSSEPSERALPQALTHIWSGVLPAMLVLVVAAAGAVEIGLRGRRAQREAVLAVLLIAALTLVLAFAWSRVSSPAWALRYLVIIVAPAVVFAGAGLSRTRVLGVAAVALATALSWHGHPSHTQLTQKSNVSAVAAALRPHLRTGDLVVTAQPEQVPALRYYLGPRMRYVTPMGVVPDPRVMDWRDALTRLRAGRFTTVVEPLLRRLRPGQRVLFVGPRFAAAGTPWSRLIMADTRIWRRALHRRLNVVATAAPDRRTGASTVAGTVLARAQTQSGRSAG